MTHVITQPCCNDAACADVCPVDCIRPRPQDPGYRTAETLYIDPSTCIDCGACVDVCPVSAIVPEDALDEAGRLSLQAGRAYFARFPLDTTAAPGRPVTGSPATTSPDSGADLRVAIIGTGPSAYYAAKELLSRTDGQVRLSIFDRYPGPGGLVRYGVSPDHARTKQFLRGFDRLARRPGVELFLNVEIGRHLTVTELLEHHHAVVHAVGATGERRLGIPGEDLPGSHPAGDLVGWYNGRPERAGLRVDLSAERAVVVGNGNVALDVARILTTDPDDLARTDIAEPALAALRHSRLREVHILGRRGPADAAFTTPELLGLDQVRGTQVLAPAADEGAAPTNDGFSAGLKSEIVTTFAARLPDPAARRIVLRFHRSPVEILGDDSVRAIRLETSGGGTETLDCGMVVRAIGYRGTAVPGLPFDDHTATVPHDRGRVVDLAGAALTGHYVVGWLKRGPSGGIGANRGCADESVDGLLDDHARGRLRRPAESVVSFADLVARRQPDRVDLDGWRAIDRHEQLAGRGTGSPRRKVLSSEEMVRVARCDARQPERYRPPDLWNSNLIT